MATLKIYQPQITPKQNANTPQISALQIDQGFAQMTGNAFKKLGNSTNKLLSIGVWFFTNLTYRSIFFDVVKRKDESFLSE